MLLDPATLAAAFAAGLVISLHCTAMCGPLVCALKVRPAGYHVTRALSYTLAGILCGAFGQVITAFFQGSGGHLVPWVFVVVLLFLGFGLERRVRPPRFLARLLSQARIGRALGWLTPLIPCGPLWIMFGAAALTGSWYGGGAHMAAFALGTIPLPLLVQTQAQRLQRFLSPNFARRTQQVLAFGSAGLLVWRASIPWHACCH